MPCDGSERPRVPAEWEEHACVYVAWPYVERDWPGGLDGVRDELAAFCRAVGRGESVRVLVADDDVERDVHRRVGDRAVGTLRATYADVWLRDTAPTFAVDGDGLVALRFTFNGWGGRYLFPDDLAVAPAVAAAAGAREAAVALVTEGGAFEFDGCGTAIATAASIVNDNRNPGSTRGDVERVLAAAAGVRRVVWLRRGLARDHTDGHVDTLARFVGPGRVVCMEARDRRDPNREVLDEVAADLTAAIDAQGRPLDVVRIPSPGRVDDDAGEPLPASYVNFYIANRTVVVPTYGVAADADAVAALASCFADRKVVGSPARTLLGGGGAFHCITQQQPVVVAGGTR